MSPDDAPDEPASDSCPLGARELGVEYWRAPELFLLDAVLTLIGVIEAAGTRPRVFVCDLRTIPVLDAHACRVISVLLGRCRRSRMALILSGVGPSALRTLGATVTLDDLGPGNVFPHLCDAMSRARILLNDD